MDKIIIIGGPTASYKSILAMELAYKYNGIIINADALQVYQEIPILSAQPSAKDQEQILHKLYGVISGEKVYSVGNWLERAIIEIELAMAMKKIPIIVGGTGLYINSLIYGLAKIPEIDIELRENIRDLYDKMGKESFYNLLYERDVEAAKKININDKTRLIRAYEVIEQTGKSIFHWQEISSIAHFEEEAFLLIIANPKREELYKNCDERFLNMLEEGVIDEIEFLHKNIQDKSLPINKAIGVSELTHYLTGYLSLSEATERAQTATRQFAKRQVTWFKNQYKDFEKIQYQSLEDFPDISRHISHKIKKVH